jgi:hypothetical protein
VSSPAGVTPSWSTRSATGWRAAAISQASPLLPKKAMAAGKNSQASRSVMICGSRAIHPKGAAVARKITEPNTSIGVKPIASVYAYEVVGWVAVNGGPPP